MEQQSAQSLRLTMRPWSKVRALCWLAVDNGPAFLGSFARFAVKTGIRSVIFGVPTAFVAQWCDVQPTWKSIAFMMFCIIWSDCVFGSKEDRSGPSAGENDPPTARHQKAAAVVLTPAEVAAEARKLSREPKPDR
jgi:hypothetical protein